MGHHHWHKVRQSLLPSFTPPRVQKSTAYSVPPRDLAHLRPRHHRLCDNAGLLLRTPPPSPLGTRENLALHLQHVLKCALKDVLSRSPHARYEGRTTALTMHLVARRNLLHRLVASQRLQRHARLELPRKPSPCRHLVSLHHPREYTLTPCPIFQDQLGLHRFRPTFPECPDFKPGPCRLALGFFMLGFP